MPTYKIPFTLNRQLPVRKTVCLLMLCATVICSIGCGPTYVGVRTSVDIPLQSAVVSLPKQNESRGLGSQIGFIFDQSFSERFSLLIEPAISTSFTDTYELAEARFPGALTLQTTHDYSFIQLPLIARFSAPIEGSSLRPYLGLGGRLALGLSGSLSTSGHYLDQSLTPVPLIDYTRNTGEVSSIDAILCAGVDMKVSDSWAFRFDSRLQRSLGDAYSIYMYIINPIQNREVYITSPLTHLSFSVSMVLRL